MKTPLPGPRLDEITEREGMAFIVEAIGAAAGPTVDGRYRHWDSLRHLEPPGGWNSEKWWAALKMARNAASRPLAYRDGAGRPFRLVQTDEMQRILHHIDREASGRIEVPELVTTPGAKRRFLVSSLQEEAITTAILEGANTTHRAAKELLRTGRPPADRSERMVVNSYEAMRHVSGQHRERITPGAVLELHRIVTDGTLDDPADAGRLQQPGEERVGVYDERGTRLYAPPPADQLPDRLRELCEFANGESEEDGFLHPVVRAVLTHFRIGVDHPFVGGNGRVARVLFYWVMLREGYWLTEFLSVSRILRQAPPKYARSYLYAEDDNDVTYFVLHQLGVLERALDDLFVWLRDRIRRIRTTEEVLGDVDLNHRQRALLAHALRNPDTRYTHQSHARSHDVTVQTANNDLTDLAERGLMTRSRAGRKYAYRLAENVGTDLVGS